MKIIHFSDTHLGFSEYNKIDPETGLNQREQDFYNAWEQVIKDILLVKPDVVVHAGDLFHTPRPSNRAIHTALQGIKKVSDAGIPMVIVSGNHETPRIRTTGSIFESIALFPHVYLAFSNQYVRFRIQNCDFHCIPHCSLTEELDGAFGMIKMKKDAEYNVFITHGAWTGGTYLGMGEFNEQRLPDIDGMIDKPFDYVALGHYHKYLKIKDHIYYSGSTERTSLNEANNTCGYILVDLDKGKKQYCDITSRPMIKLPVQDCRGKSTDQIYTFLRELSNKDLDKAIVLVVLDNIEDNTFVKLDVRIVDELFPQVFHLEKYFRRLANDMSGKNVSTRIDSLAIEFERYIDGITNNEFDQKQLLDLGVNYLTRED